MIERHPVSLVAISVSLLVGASCVRIHPIQLAPPVAIPVGLVWGYGVEPIDGRPDQARRTAYLDAVDDFLSRGPVIVSREVRDSTTADNDSSLRTIESTFQLRAASILEPRFVREGFEDGFSWVVVGASEDDIELGWEEFLAWRDMRIEEARLLFEQAEGPNRLGLLEASMNMLEEAGAVLAPGLLYHRVRLALDDERARIARLDRFRTDINALIVTGELVAAERMVAEALVFGLEIQEYESFQFLIADQRSRAAAAVAAGDTLYNGGQYKESLERYAIARRLDISHPGLETRAARAESAHRSARARTTSRTIGVIGGVVGEYFRWQREEAREEAREAAPEDRRRDDDDWERVENVRSRPDYDRSGSVTVERRPADTNDRGGAVTDSREVSGPQPTGGGQAPRAPVRDRSAVPRAAPDPPAREEGRGPLASVRDRASTPETSPDPPSRPSRQGGRGPLAAVRNQPPAEEPDDRSGPEQAPSP